MSIINYTLDRCDNANCNREYAPGEGGCFDSVYGIDICLECMKENGWSNCGSCGRIVPLEELGDGYECYNCQNLADTHDNEQYREYRSVPV